MKAKNKVLFDRYNLYFRGVWKKPNNYPSLLDMVQRRIGWRVDVLRCCDNWEEIVSTDRKVLSNYCNPKVFHFPKKRCVSPKVFDPRYSMQNEYHIVRKKNNRYKVVRKKPKKRSIGRTLVVDTKRGYIRNIRDKVWYHPDWLDFGCYTCADYGTCFTNGRHDKSFCAMAAKCGIGRGNTWQEVREDNDQH